MLWICAENSVDNTEIFSLLLSLHNIKAFAAPHPTPTSEQAGGQEEWEGDTAGTADQRGIPDHMMMPSV